MAAAKSALFTGIVMTVAVAITTVTVIAAAIATAIAAAIALDAFLVPEIVGRACGVDEPRSTVKGAVPVTNSIGVVTRVVQRERTACICARVIFAITIIIMFVAIIAIAVCAWFIGTHLASLMPYWSRMLADVDSSVVHGTARPVGVFFDGCSTAHTCVCR